MTPLPAPPRPFSSPLALTWREKASSCLAFAAALEELATVAPSGMAFELLKAARALRRCAGAMVEMGAEKALEPGI